MKAAVESLLKRFGLRILRTPANRFDALDEALHHLRLKRFRPSGIIDSGANRGQWAQRVIRHFPETPILLIEPQEACQPSLDVFRRRFPQAAVEQIAPTSPGVDGLWMSCAGWGAGPTGTRVLDEESRPDERIRVPAGTRDAVMSRRTDSFRRDPLFLKLDLEGHELAALDGATATLGRTEVILIETRLLGTSLDAPQDFEAFLDFARAAGFVLYDIVSLSGRPFDDRLRLMDVIFVRRGGWLEAERRWVVGTVKTG